MRRRGRVVARAGVRVGAALVLVLGLAGVPAAQASVPRSRGEVAPSGTDIRHKVAQASDDLAQASKAVTAAAARRSIA